MNPDRSPKALSKRKPAKPVSRVLDSASIVGFIPTTDYDHAKAFYLDKLGLQFVSKDDFAMVFKTGRTMIRVVKVPDFIPACFTILGWQVEDIQKHVKLFTKRGVVFERFPLMKQDALGIWSAPGGACVAWFKDPDGNVLSLSAH